MQIKTGENKQTEVKDKQTAKEELKKKTPTEKNRIMKEAERERPGGERDCNVI